MQADGYADLQSVQLKEVLQEPRKVAEEEAKATRIDKMRAIVILMVLAALTTSGAFSIRLSANKTNIDINQNITFTMTASGGVIPYYFQIQNSTGTYIDYLQTTNGSAYYHISEKQAGVWRYKIYANDWSGLNESNTIINITVNATPKIYLSPQNKTIPAPIQRQYPYNTSNTLLVTYTYLTFSNSIIGGSPPFTYHYNVSILGGTGTFNRTNNTIGFNGAATFLIKLTANDLFNYTTNATTYITTAYQPSYTAIANCTIIQTIPQAKYFGALIDGYNISVVVNYLTPNMSGITIGGASGTLYEGKGNVTIGNYSASLLNVSWEPNVRTDTLLICFAPKPITTTSTTSSTSTITTSALTSSTTTLTQTSTITTTQPTTSITQQQLNGTYASLWPTIILGIVVIIVVIALYLTLGKA